MTLSTAICLTEPAKKVWEPQSGTQLADFMQGVNAKYGLSLNCYQDIYAWSVTHTAEFWAEVATYCELPFHTPYTQVVDDPNKLPGAKWFEGATLNVAEVLLKHQDDHAALVYINETDSPQEMSYKALAKHVACFASRLRAVGIEKGDRVAAIVTNGPEAIVAFLATASLGAVWSSCSPDFGVTGILDRMTQIEAKVLISVSGYTYHGKTFELTEKLTEISAKLPTIESLFVIPNQGIEIDPKTNCPIQRFSLKDPLTPAANLPLVYTYTNFQDPLYILYSSGTTGKPKAIVHSAGGTLIQHLKEHRLHCDLTRDDKLFYFTTCGWMMWNWMVSGLATGATLVLFDGSPTYPNMTSCWELIDKVGITIFGTSAKFIATCQEKNIRPKEALSLESLRTILSTGSPLMEEQFDYIYDHIKPTAQISSISGGTDIVSCFVLGCPIEPVYRGFLQCRGLGMAVDAIDQDGNSVINQTGELICRKAAPCMPIYFWNDPEGKRFQSSYFDAYPGVWHHGDFIYLHETGHLKVLGRSDATLNPGGVRIGTSEIYRVVEALDEVADSLVIGKQSGGDETIVLYVQLVEGEKLSKDLRSKILSTIKEKCSPRHLPRRLYQVPEIPYTMNGKKVELAVKQLVEGKEIKNKSALRNPECLAYFS